MSNVKGKGQRLIPEELLKYLDAYKEAHPDPTAGGGATLDDIVDSHGNKRFIEGEGTPATVDGFTSTYCKWSLSGTHLMLVLAGSVANETTITTRNICDFEIPKFILDKVTPVVTDNIERKIALMYASNISTQNLALLLYKDNTKLKIYNTASVTLTENRNFRVQFDLLIDSE